MAFRSLHDQDEGDLETGTRVCTHCQTRKPMAGFHWTSGKRYRFRSCKECANARRVDAKAVNPENEKLTKRETHLRRKYGLTPRGFDQLLAQQDGNCAICSTNLSASVHVDHDHATGKVRGLLCFTCNTALGKFRDSVSLLRAAINYLSRPTPQVETRDRALSSEEMWANRSTARRKSRPVPSLSHSRSVSGIRNPATCLTEEKVAEIRRRYALGDITQRQLGAEYGCTQGAISSIVLGKNWKFASEPPTQKETV